MTQNWVCFRSVFEQKLGPYKVCIFVNMGPFGKVAALPWPSMLLFGPVWSCMVPNSPLGLPMVSRVQHVPLWFLWSCMFPYGSIWSRMVLYGQMCSPMVLYAPLWLRMLWYGYVLSRMALYVLLWSCMVFEILLLYCFLVKYINSSTSSSVEK